MLAACDHDEDAFPGAPFPGRFVPFAGMVLIAVAFVGAHLGPAFETRGFTSLAPAVREMPDFDAIPNPETRKARFFAYLLPAIQRANARVRARRHRLLAIAERHARGALPYRDRQWLARFAARYGVEVESVERRIAELKSRIDTLPAGLILAQAAIESGWGTSRFARQGNSLFGEWCFEPGCGIVPGHRPEGRSYEVRSFATVTGSIRSYLGNINSHPAYAHLRALRAAARAAGREPRGVVLAGGLEQYSARGSAYVDDVRTIIRGNELVEMVGGSESMPRR